jgi:NTE family protein
MSSGEWEGETPDDPRYFVNGVFQGGGAKSIANVGALQAFADQGLWFGSVAGSSAGAITASLIAAGIPVGELDKVIPDALGTLDTPIAGRLGRAVLGRATAVYQNDGLREWLDERLAQAIEILLNSLVLSNSSVLPSFFRT